MPTLIALLVCLIPTTIGALLAAIGIAGMDRAMQANIISKSGKAVELAGDIDVVLLDKTGTITLGNRHATNFLPVGKYKEPDLARLAALASAADDTPEGKSIVKLFEKQTKDPINVPTDSISVPFTAQTRMSGIDFSGGRQIRKGAPDAVFQFVGILMVRILPKLIRSSTISAGRAQHHWLLQTVLNVAGVISLEDILKPNMKKNR